MVRVGEALRRGVSLLQEAGADSPQLDAEVLLGHHLGLDRSRLLARLDVSLSPHHLEGYQILLERRRLREPVAYIIGYKEFYGLRIQVDSRVLIPRPETEILVDVALAMARKGRTPIAEVGVGSGAVSVALAVKLPQIRICAIDSSPEALEVARENCLFHGVGDRVSLVAGDLLEPLPGPVGLMVANLPYLSHKDLEEAPPEVAHYEPRQALDGGPDGLVYYRRFLAQAPCHLKPGGSICMEIGAKQARVLGRLTREYFPQAQVALVKDLAGLDRVMAVAS